MKNYDLERLAVTNHKMHVFLGRAKVSKGRESSDYRLFTRYNQAYQILTRMNQIIQLSKGQSSDTRTS